MIRQLTEEQIGSMAGDAECPVIEKAESEPMEAAVCLKQFPSGYVLGVSDKAKGIEFWYTTDLGEAMRAYEKSLKLMQTMGSPLAVPNQ